MLHLFYILREHFSLISGIYCFSRALISKASIAVSLSFSLRCVVPPLCFKLFFPGKVSSALLRTVAISSLSSGRLFRTRLRYGTETGSRSVGCEVEKRRYRCARRKSYNNEQNKTADRKKVKEAIEEREMRNLFREKKCPLAGASNAHCSDFSSAVAGRASDRNRSFLVPARDRK